MTMTLSSIAPPINLKGKDVVLLSTGEPGNSAMQSADFGDPTLPLDTAALLIHDLKCPLSALTMNLEFALSELPEGPTCDDVREALHDCRAAGARLFRMVTNLLDISRAEAGRLIPRTSAVSVRTLLQSIAHSALSDPRARHMTFTTAGYDGEFDLDPEMMVRVLDCVMDAVLSQSRGGTSIELSAHVRNGELELTIPTLGPPLAPEERTLVFSKHSRLSGNGFDRGMGLYFCRMAVEAHGGGIALYEGSDRRSFFRILIPQRGQALSSR
jgi:K+-sensing histidine kinase KdpD